MLVAGEADEREHVADARADLRRSAGRARAGRRRRSRRPTGAGTARSSGTRSRCCAGWPAAPVTSCAAEADASGVRHLEAGDHPQRRRLAAAGGAEQRQELARAHVEHDVARRVDLALDAVRVALRHAVDVARRSVPPSSASSSEHAGHRRGAGRAEAGAARGRSAAITTNTITTTSTENAAAGPERELGDVLEDLDGDERPADRHQEDRRADRRHRADEHDAAAPRRTPAGSAAA